MTGDGTLKLRHQRDEGVLISTEIVDQVGLIGTSKGSPVDGANACAVVDALQVFSPNPDWDPRGE